MPREKRPNSYPLQLSADYRGMAMRIADILAEQRPHAAKGVSKAEAIRYAIAFCHKQLTEVINPEDLDYD